jgi:hypothetical protein
MNSYRVARTQTVALSGTSAQSAAIGDQIRSVRLIVKGGTGAHVLIGENPVATASNTFVVTNSDSCILFTVNPGEKIAAIQGGTGGTLLIDELTG